MSYTAKEMDEESTKNVKGAFSVLKGATAVLENEIKKKDQDIARKEYFLECRNEDLALRNNEIKKLEAEIKELKEFKDKIHWKNYELDTAMKNAKLRIHQDLGIWVSIKDSSGLTKSYYLGKIVTIA
jgi:uncharacterized protein (DUF3084 family)